MAIDYLHFGFASVSFSVMIAEKKVMQLAVLVKGNKQDEVNRKGGSKKGVSGCLRENDTERAAFCY